MPKLCLIPTRERAARATPAGGTPRQGRATAAERPSGELEAVYIMLPLRCLCGAQYPSDVHLEICVKARNG